MGTRGSGALLLGRVRDSGRLFLRRVALPPTNNRGIGTGGSDWKPEPPFSRTRVAGKDTAPESRLALRLLLLLGRSLAGLSALDRRIHRAFLRDRYQGSPGTDSHEAAVACRPQDGAATCEELPVTVDHNDCPSRNGPLRLAAASLLLFRLRGPYRCGG